MKPFFSIVLLLTFLIAPLANAADSDIDVLPQYQYLPSDSVMEQVETARLKAIQADKLLLLVLGAQWCHDRRGLSQQFSTPTLHEIISNRFETVLVNVGYYKDYRGLTRQFGYPGYFATPSVMVIEPQQQQLLNMQTMPTWNAAHSVSSEEYLDYFSTIGTAEIPEPESLSTEQKERVSQVHNFANQQTARLFEGFKLISPLLQGAVEDQLNDFTELEALSDEAYAFRMQLQKDIHTLHQLALESDQALGYPSYGPFSWEAH